ncbi:CD209 antigen-like protein E isoform X1 [Octodon degus]|uniref:CD209 antigen-like protein E isoform X1 n=1 Tax=Octodon degus TaxID=10160 RepID=A0A6P6DLP8_OCTDE|nr:CD209 antigen-like protein E isoform X1 [Octodon degus]
MALTMTATEEAQAQKLGPLGCHLHHSISLVLKLLLFMLFAGILVAILAKVSTVPSRQEYEQDQSKQKQTSQELTQLKDRMNNLCRPCSWEWKFFQGNCYFLSKSQRNWHDSVTACKEEGAQLVIVESAEEQSFLQQISKSKGRTWIGLSDLNKEGVWHWVDGSPLSNSFKKYWNPGEPNSSGEEDCAEYKGDGWNDSICSHKKFWICKRSANSCPRE